MITLKPVDYLPEPVPRLPNRLVPFMWYFIRQFRSQFILLLVVWGLSNIILGCISLFFKYFVAAFEDAQTTAQVLENLMLPAGLFILLQLIIQPILAQTGVWIQAKTIPNFVNMMRRQLALYMHHHSYEYFQSDFSGRLASKVVETPGAMGQIVHTLVGAIWYASVYFIVAVILFTTAHWSFVLVTAVWILSYVLLLRYYIPKIQHKSKRGSDQRSIVRGRFVDTISNILTVKLFARRKHEDAYLLEALEETANRFQAVDMTLFRMSGWLEVITSLFWFAVIVCLVLTWNTGDIGASDVAMILPLALQVTQTSWWMSEIFTNFFEKLGEVQEGMETITQSHDVLDRPGAVPLNVDKGRIQYDNLTFSYGEKVVFDGLHVDIPPGQKVGLVGPSGAGKSTFIQVLLRLFEVQDGQILIDGQNIAGVKQDSLRQNIAVIPQATDLLHRSIRDNIRYARLDATEEEIIDAARKAHAHDFIMDLSDKIGNSGYDTYVGERGVRLSGGQRQRIAIARAFLKNAPILVLDEATSALDSESERLIQDSLFKLMEGKTVIAIAHRLSTIAHLDRLLVMEEGKIIEDGTHDELLKKKGYYARLWDMQSGGFIGG